MINNEADTFTGFVVIGKLEDLPIERFNLFQIGIARVAAGTHVRQGRGGQSINIFFFHSHVAQARRNIDVAIQLRHRLNCRGTRFGNRQGCRRLVTKRNRDVAILLAGKFGVISHNMRQQHRISHTVRRAVKAPSG